LLLEENNAFTRGEKLHLITSQEYELFGENYTDIEQTTKRITEKVLAFAQAKYLRQVEMMNEDLELSFEFVLITAEKNENGIWKESARLPIEERTDVSGNITFKEGDFFKIKVTNNGFDVAYYSILDFQPDNIINVLIPGKYENAADFSIKPGEERELPKVYRFGKPFGTEVFKLVASKQPIAFRDVLVSKGDQRSAAFTNSNPFAELVSSSFRSESTSRSSETPSVPVGDCNIYSVSFSIVPKE